MVQEMGVQGIVKQQNSEKRSRVLVGYVFLCDV